MKASGPRHLAREYALRILYGLDIQKERGIEHPLFPKPNFWEADDKLHITHHAIPFGNQLIHKVLTEQDKIDEIIKKHSHHWRITRMSPVDRNILRLAVCEMQYNPETSPRVIINEALELAKCYADTQSPSFLNGILDSIAKYIQSDNNQAIISSELDPPQE